MKLKLKLTIEEIIEKFFPNLPPETGVAIEIEEAGAETTSLGVKQDCEATKLNFGEALELMKQGKKMFRRGWDWEAQFVYYVPEDHGAHFAAKTVQGDIVVWVPNTSDCLSEDWYETAD